MLSRTIKTILKKTKNISVPRYRQHKIVFLVLSIIIAFVAYIVIKNNIFPDLSPNSQVIILFVLILLGNIFMLRYLYRARLAQEALRQSEERYRTLAEFAYDWEYWLDPDNKFIYTSPSCKRITGYGRSEFVNEPSLLAQIIHPVDRAIMEKHVHEISSTGESVPIEFRIVHRNGEERWIEHASQTVYGSDGRFLGRRACNRDITWQKQAERESALSLSLLRATVESIADGILVVDWKGTIRLYNQRFLEMWQVPQTAVDSGDDSQLLGTVLEQLKDPQGFLSGVRELYAKSDVQSRDLIVFKDGRVFERSSQPHRMGTQIVGRVWGFHDVTERIQAQEKLRKYYEELETLNEELIANNEELMAAEEELRLQYDELQQGKQELKSVNQRLQNIIEFLPDATFVVDHEKKVVAWNRAIEEMTNVPKADMIGKGNYAYAIPFYGKSMPILIDLISQGAELEPKYQHLTQKGDTLFAEFRVPSLYQGRGAFLWVKASPMYDADGNVIGAIQTIRDITERKQAEDKLKYLSLHDSLTGLYNRAYFEQEMRRFTSGRYSPVGIILCDVDGLKLINDTMGHDSGDKLLVTAASVLMKTFRDEDVVARIGGDEFAVLLPNSDIVAVERASTRFRDAVFQYNLENPELILSISLGFAVSDGIPADLDIVFKEADNNMYRIKLHSSQSTRSAIVQTLMKALEARDYITEGHADRLQELVAIVALSLGLPERSIGDLRLLAQFHDIGKVGIPDRILFKKGSLTNQEFAEMKQHCEIGHRIALSAPDLVPIADWILKHHEWWNGKGYPLGLKGEEIPLECRILAIADAYDAMTSDRPYRKALPHSAAIAELKKCAGCQFDPQLVKMVVQHLESQKQEYVEYVQRLGIL